MMKKFVIVKHMEDNGKFLFRVPMGEQLEVGDMVVCDTMRGKNQLGVCCCDSFLGDPEVVCPLFGTVPQRMRFVTGKVEIERYAEAILDEEDEELKEEEERREAEADI